jgi:hypothetical protein
MTAIATVSDSFGLRVAMLNPIRSMGITGDEVAAEPVTPTCVTVIGALYRLRQAVTLNPIQTDNRTYIIRTTVFTQ